MAPNQIAFYPQSSGGAGLPTASAAGQVPTSTGAGTTYTAQVPTYTQISQQILATTPATVTVAIPTSAYTTLKLVIKAGNAANSASAYGIKCNGDATGGNYFINYSFGAFSTNTISGVGAFASTPGMLIAPNNSETTFYVQATGANISTQGNGSGNVALFVGAGEWVGATQLTTITIAPVGSANFLSGGSFTLYGIQ